LFIAPHITPVVIELLSTPRVRVVVVTFAPQPHITHIFRVLDLAQFGVAKRRGQYQLRLENDVGRARFIKKMDHDHDFRVTMTITESNIWGISGHRAQVFNC
jgi:hypothetical protein